MRRALCVALLATCLAPGCGRRPAEDGDVLASYRGGAVRLEELDRAVLALPEEERRPEDGDYLAWYEELVRDVARRELLVRRAEQAGVELDPGFRERWAEVERQVLVERFLERHMPPPQTPGEELLRAEFERDRASFERPARRLVFHLFLRTGEERDAREAAAELAALRARAVAGEPFQRLARGHSDSESRHRDGLLGWVERGDLPPPLDEVVFALTPGVPSEPVVTSEGLHLFWVEEAVEAKGFDFAEARSLVARRWLAGERARRIAELVDEESPPAGSFVPTREELALLLAEGDSDSLVLSLGELELSVADVEAILSAPAAPPPGGSDAPWEVVEALVDRELLVLRARREGLAEEPDTARRLAALKRQALARAMLSRLVAAEAEAATSEIEEHYRRHRMRFSAPLELRLRLLSTPLGAAAAERMARLERAAEELGPGGEGALEELAEAVGGTVTELGWTSLEALSRRHPQAVPLVAGLPAGSLSPPYRTLDSLELLAVDERREPVARPFAEVRDAVVADWLRSRAGALEAEVGERLLEEAELTIDRQALARLPGVRREAGEEAEPAGGGSAPGGSAGSAP